MNKAQNTCKGINKKNSRLDTKFQRHCAHISVKYHPPVSVNAYIGENSPARLQSIKLLPVQKGDVTATNEHSLWWPRLIGFPCIASDPVLALARELVDDLQNFKCFFPVVTMNFASDENLTDATAEKDEHALTFAAKIPLRQSHKQRYPSWENPTDTRYLPEQIKTIKKKLWNDKLGKKFMKALPKSKYIMAEAIV